MILTLSSQLKKKLHKQLVTADTSLTRPEANLNVVPSDNQLKKKEKNKKKNYGSGPTT